MTRRHHQAGFTLLEMLVALCVLGLLSAAISRGLDVAVFSFIRAQHDTLSAKRQRDAGRLLRDLIGGAAPEFAAAGVEDRRITFEGTADSVRFITRRPARLGTPVMIAAHLFLSGDNKLMVGWRLDLPRADGAGALPDSETVVADHVGAVRFAYAGSAGWQKDFAGETALPWQVSIAIQDDDPSHRAWPTLVIAPRATATPSCVYDPTDSECARSQ
jgi:prepilin-type N-terminal cleavage/methylation domain-containing protein